MAFRKMPGEEKWGIELTANNANGDSSRRSSTSEHNGEDNSKKSLSSVMGLLGVNEVLPGGHESDNKKSKHDKNNDDKQSIGDGSIFGDFKGLAASGGSLSSAFFEDYSIHQAAREGVLSSVREQLDELRSKGVDVFRVIDHLDNEGFSPLHHAAKFNRAEVVEYLLDMGAYIDVSGDEHNSPLHLATRYNSIDAAKLLLQHSANAGLKNIYGSTPLHFAARRGCIEIAESLITQRGVVINGTDNGLLTPLHQACLGGFIFLVRLLIKQGANVNARDVEGDTPLHAAAGEGYQEVIQFLLETVEQNTVDKTRVKDECLRYVNAVNAELDTPLHVAAQGGYEDAVRALLAKGADVNAKTDTNTTPLHLASVSGQLGVARILLNSGAKINAKDQDQMTPLHRAALFGRTELIHHLLQRGALINAKDKDNFTPLLCAVWKGQINTVKELIQKGAKIYFVDSSLKSCVHLAVQYSHVDVLELLLLNGGSDLINSSDKDYKTPLHSAASLGHVKAIEILLGHKANVDVSDNEEKTPLHVAAESGKAFCARLLGEAQPGILNSTDERGRTPLHLAAMNGHVKVTKFLLEMGAEIDSRDDVNWTPLDHASRFGFYKTMSVLLENDAPIDASDKNRNTPLHLASKHGHVDAVILLFDGGADISLRDMDGKNCLDLAVEHYQREVCMALVQHDRWKEIVSNSDADDRQPMEKLIRVAPEVAEVVLDKCLDYSKHPRNDPEFSITYNFQYLDVHPDLRPKKRSHSYFGPKSMVAFKREKLLSHAVSQRLIEMKWNRIGRIGYYLSFLSYVAFVVLVTAFAIIEKEAFLKNKESKAIDSDSTSAESFASVVPYLALVVCGFQLIKEVIQLWFLGLRYFADPNNYLELVLYGSTILFMVPFATKTISNSTEEIRWHAGAISILFTWINLLLFLRRFPFFGLYVVMFVEVLKTVGRVLLVFSIFIVAFALSFYVLLAKQKTFGNVPRSMIKTLVMTIGEFEYDTILTNNLFVGDGRLAELPYPFITYVIFVTFVILMPIIIMNLLVGLAVGDIEAVRKSAYLRILEQQVDVLQNLERNLPSFFLRWAFKPNLVVKPNQSSWIKTVRKYVGYGDNQYEYLKADTSDESLKENLLVLQIDRQKNELVKQKKRMKRLFTILEEQNEVLKLMSNKMGITTETEAT